MPNPGPLTGQSFAVAQFADGALQQRPAASERLQKLGLLLVNDVHHQLRVLLQLRRSGET